MYLTGPGRVGKARTTPLLPFPPLQKAAENENLHRVVSISLSTSFCKFNRVKSRLRGFDAGIVSSHPLQIQTYEMPIHRK